MLQAYLAYNASEAKSREGSWILIKRCMWIFVAHILIKAVQIGISMWAISSIIEEWDESYAAEGSYMISDGESVMQFDWTHSGPHSDSFSDEDEELVILAVVSLFLLFTVIALCMFSCCCLCMFGLYFKFHYSIKDYEHVC